jgi:hypothetical protein
MPGFRKLVIHNGTLRNEPRKQTGISVPNYFKGLQTGFKGLQTGGLAAVDKALAQPYLCKT